MSVIKFARPVAPTGAWRKPLLRLFIVIGAAALAACTTTVAPVVGADPSDSGARVRPVSYKKTTAGYVSLRPVPPAPWRRQNERVAPQPKSEQ